MSHAPPAQAPPAQPPNAGFRPRPSAGAMDGEHPMNLELGPDVPSSGPPPLPLDSTAVMLDPVDDYMGTDFGDLNSMEGFDGSPRVAAVGPEQAPAHAPMEDVAAVSMVQDGPLDSFGDIGGSPRRGSSLDALGLAGLDFDSAPPASAVSDSPSSESPSFFGASGVPDAPSATPFWPPSLKSEPVEDGTESEPSLDGAASASGSAVGSFTGMEAARRRSDSSDSVDSSASSGAKSKRRGRTKSRRKSAPDLALAVNPTSSFKTSKKEYHNRAERERTRKINASIQEIKALTGCAEPDKVSILQTAVRLISEMNASGGAAAVSSPTSPHQRPPEPSPMEVISPLFDCTSLDARMLSEPADY